MKNIFIIILLSTFTFIISSCNKNAKRFNSNTTINPELLGKWVSTDGCKLELVKQNNELIMLGYHDTKSRNLDQLKLKFKPYSIALLLANSNNKDPKFNAKYIDGAIIIDNACHAPLRKIE